MHRRSSAFCVVALTAITTLATLVPLVSGGLPKAVASTPNSGTVSAASPTVQWHESAPLNGSAPSRRNQTCVAGGTPCDDYMLTVNRDGIPGDAKLSFTLESSSPGQVNLLFYPPGCSGDASSTDTCYQVYTDQGSMMNPANGTYLLRVACMVCAGTTYKATATLGPFTVNIPAAADQSFGWASKALKAKPETAFGEPGISINKLGHVIVNTFGPTVWISTDNGENFGDPLDSIDSTPCNQSFSGDSDAVVSDDDTYYADNLC